MCSFFSRFLLSGENASTVGKNGKALKRKNRFPTSWKTVFRFLEKDRFPALALPRSGSKGVFSAFLQ